MKSNDAILIALIAIILLLVYYQHSLPDFIDSLFPYKDAGNKSAQTTMTTTSTTYPENLKITASASILALNEREFKSILGEKWEYFKKPYFMPAGEISYGKYVQDIYDGSKNIDASSNTSVTFTPKRRIRIYTEVYKGALPLGMDVFDARINSDWEEINENIYKHNYNPASPDSLNVDYEIYYRNVNVLMVSENLEILYIRQADDLAIMQLEKMINMTSGKSQAPQS